MGLGKDQINFFARAARPLSRSALASFAALQAVSLDLPRQIDLSRKIEGDSARRVILRAFEEKQLVAKKKTN